MEVLLVTPELAPVARSGALGDATAALAKTLAQLDHRVTVAIPRYGCVEQAGLLLARRLTLIRLPVADGSVEATLFDGQLGSGVEVLVVDVPGAFDRDGIYGQGGTDYPDNARRFGLFCRAVAEVVHKRAREQRPFDVVHLHDWPTALLAFLLSGQVRSVLTFTDASRQGLFPASAVDEIGLSHDDFHPDSLEFYGKLNLLKAGLAAADVVTTVSESYAREVQTAQGGAGLDGVFRARARSLFGIPTGIDYSVWSPAVDPHLPARFDAEDTSAKVRCKARLCYELGLSVDAERPLAVALDALDRACGTDLVADALGAIVRTGVQVVVAGEGDPALRERLERAVAEWPAETRMLGAVPPPMVHRIVAAADLMLLPHRFQPGGSGQLVAQRYGALPVAHAVAGHLDSVIDCDARGTTGTGVLFDEPSVASLVGGVERAVALMRSPRWPALRRRLMRLDVSWDRAARRYSRLYQGPDAS